MLDDENGDPVRIDLGKRMKLGPLGYYNGFTMDFSRLLQFSPTDTKFSPAPFFSYLTGDSDWRVKKYLNNEMSFIELAAGAVSPSITQLATGIAENNYQKRWGGLSYMLTGFATKSTAHAEIANDYFITNNYSKMLKAPKNLRKDFYDRVLNGKMDDKGLRAMKVAQDRGLMGPGSLDRSEFGVKYNEDLYKMATRNYGKFLTLGQSGDVTRTEDYYKEVSRDYSELIKHIISSDVLNHKGGPDDWLDKVTEFAKDGYLDDFEKANPAYGKAMRHYYELKDYYSNKMKNQDIAYGDGYNDYERAEAKAKLIASTYELEGAGKSLEEKVDSLLHGTASFIFDPKNGYPELTEEREREIEYKGFLVQDYEKTLSRFESEKSMRNMYWSISYAAKAEGNRKLQNHAAKLAQKFDEAAKNSFKQIKEDHTIEAELYVLEKEQKEKAYPDSYGKDWVKTKPIVNYIEKREQSLNEYYNEIANQTINHIENTEVKWNSLNNLQKQTFRMNNNGLTINQAKEDLRLEKEFWEGMKDMNISKKYDDDINKLKQIYE